MNTEINQNINPAGEKRSNSEINPILSTVGSLAMAIIENQRLKGHDITIPSLGIVIKGEPQVSEDKPINNTETES